MLRVVHLRKSERIEHCCSFDTSSTNISTMPARGYRKAASGSFINTDADAEQAHAGTGIEQFELPKSTGRCMEAREVKQKLQWILTASVYVHSH